MFQLHGGKNPQITQITQSKHSVSFFPEARHLVADDPDGRVISFALVVLADLLQGPAHVRVFRVSSGIVRLRAKKERSTNSHETTRTDG